jgi:uncharacterized protein YjbI with pentapeptide repeats
MRTNLVGASFSGATLDRAKFVTADATDADFADARAVGTDFTKTNLTRASFKGADLRRARFFEAILINADFTGARLEGADLLNADFSGATWTDGETVCAAESIGRCK